jgi:phage host-nuclease inhibitor protein Gam
MNKKRRAALEKIKAGLEGLREEIEVLQVEEQEYVDNMPENLQEGERCKAAEDAAETLDSVVGSLDEAIDSLDELI